MPGSLDDDSGGTVVPAGGRLVTRRCAPARPARTVQHVADVGRLCDLSRHARFRALCACADGRWAEALAILNGTEADRNQSLERLSRSVRS